MGRQHHFEVSDAFVVETIDFSQRHLEELLASKLHRIVHLGLEKRVRSGNKVTVMDPCDAFLSASRDFAIVASYR